MSKTGYANMRKNMAEKAFNRGSLHGDLMRSSHRAPSSTVRPENIKGLSVFRPPLPQLGTRPMRKPAFLLLLCLLTLPSAQAFATGDSWPTFRGDNARTGYTEAKIYDDYERAWRFKDINPQNASATSVVLNNRIIYYEEWYTYRAFNLDDGAELWNYSAPHNRDQIDLAGRGSFPAISAEAVFCGSANGHIYAINRTTGEEIWNQETHYSPHSPPAYENGVLYVGAANYAFALNASNGNIIWRYETDYNIKSAPALAHGLAYFVDTLGRLYALDAEGNGNGTTDLIWAPQSGVILYSLPWVTSLRWTHEPVT